MCNMRIKKNITILAIAILNIVATFFVMLKLSGDVPINLFAADNRGRMLSKYMLLVIPALTLVISILQVLYRVKTMDKTVTVGKIIEDALFTIIDGLLIAANWYLVYISIDYTKTSILHYNLVPVYYIISIICGIVLAALYSTYPINKFGTIFGIRTKETLEDKEVWRIANRFNGFTGFVSSLIIILLSVYFIVYGFNLTYLIIAIFVCGFLMFIIPPMYAKMVYKRVKA